MVFFKIGRMGPDPIPTYDWKWFVELENPDQIAKIRLYMTCIPVTSLCGIFWGMNAL